MNGLEAKSHAIRRVQLLQACFNTLEILAQPGKIYPTTLGWKRIQPLPAVAEHFESAVIISALNMIISHTHLQYPPVKLPNGAFFSPPGCFQFLVGLEIFAGVKIFQALYYLGWQNSTAIKGKQILRRNWRGCAGYHSGDYIGKMLNVQCGRNEVKMATGAVPV